MILKGVFVILFSLMCFIVGVVLGIYEPGVIFAVMMSSGWALMITGLSVVIIGLLIHASKKE